MRAYLRIVICALAMSVCAVSNAQWTLTSSEHQSMYGMTTVSSIISTYPHDQTWSVICPNWFYVVGDSTQSPPWSQQYANLCQNDWEYSQEFSHYLLAFDVVYNDEYYEERWGHETFLKNDYSESARRDMLNGSAHGYHVTDHCYYEIGHDGEGGG